MSELIQSIEQNETNLIVCIAGEMNFESSPDLHTRLVQLTEEDVDHLVVDLSQVAFIDSSGVSTLLEIMGRLKRAGHRLSLINPRDQVRGVFEVTKMNQIFSIYDSREEALGS